MGSYAERAIQILKDHGYRITKPRRLVVEALDSANHAMSPYEIKALLESQGEHVDTVSIYRILECLETHNLVHRLLLQQGKVLKCRLDDESHCHLPQSDHCHHFLICEQCDTIQELHCLGLQPMVMEVASHTGFKVKKHHLEFVGLCPQCA